MIKLSAGTAKVLGLKELKMDVPPTTGYLLLGEKCLYNCGFCSQARESKARPNLLSRVLWPEYPGEQVFALLDKAYRDGGLKRACLQAVHGGTNDYVNLKETIVKIKDNTGLPLCVSAKVNTSGEVGALLESGADKVCIALDAVTPEIYRKVKGGGFEQRLLLLKECAQVFLGRMSTHLIVGLGETEEEMIRVIQDMVDLGVIIGLFAFTPVKGTGMAGFCPPDLSHYRRVQIAAYLIKGGHCRLEELVFHHGRLAGVSLAKPDLHELLAEGDAFRTMGCPDCNRPFYNEKPGGIIYNYPRPLTVDEAREAIRQSGLMG